MNNFLFSLLLHLLLLLLQLLVICTNAQSTFDFPDVIDENEDEDKSLEKDILVIPNRFPKRLNWFCYPRNELMKDRLCMGEIDAFALACADDNPPIQLVPFCLAYKHQCSKANYPSEDWCEKEFDHYHGFCTKCDKNPCISFTHEITCYCEPYDNLWLRHGFQTARWCQKYELICDEKRRRDKGSELIQLMENRIKVHYRCLHLFNFADVVCNPFSTRFDWFRCMKFLFDCELISDWEEEDYDEVGVVPAPKEEKPKMVTKTKPQSTIHVVTESSISDQAEVLLKKGLTKQQLAENAAERMKEKEIASVVIKP